MRPWFLSGLAWMAATIVLLPVCAFTTLLLAGPHSDILPDALQPVAFLACVLIALVVPGWLARVVWRRTAI